MSWSLVFNQTGGAGDSGNVDTPGCIDFESFRVFFADTNKKVATCFFSASLMMCVDALATRGQCCTLIHLKELMLSL